MDSMPFLWHGWFAKLGKGVCKGRTVEEKLKVNYLREQRSQEWFDKFEAMSIDEIAALLGALSNYLLSDAMKRRCGIAQGENGVVRTVKEILFSLAGGELSLSEATSMLGVTDSGHALRLLAEAGMKMPRLPSETVARQVAETHGALKACLLPPGEKVKGASKDEQ